MYHFTTAEINVSVPRVRGVQPFGAGETVVPSGKAINIGLVFLHTLAYYRRALRGVWRYAESRPNWQLTPIPPQRGVRNLHERFQPNGLIVTANTRHLDRELQSWQRPAVNVSAVISSQRFARVGVDNELVGQMAAGHFLERGLRHFAFVGPAKQQFSMQRRASFCRALGESGAEAHCYISRSRREFDPLGMRWDLESDVQRWLRQLPKPVGIFAPNDVWGVQVVLASRRAELRVPEQVAVLGVDDDDLFCELTRPGLSSVIVPSEQIGYEAMALLERLIGGEKPPSEPLLLPPVGVHMRRSSEVLAIEDQLVAQAVQFIQENTSRPLRVEEVITHLCVGRRTLERRFRDLLGTGIAEQVRMAHLQRARRLLAQTDLSVHVVAMRAGFEDYRQMVRLFRHTLDTTPTGYRDQVSGSR